MKTKRNQKNTQKRTKNNLLKIVITLMLAGIIISGIFVIMRAITKHQNNSSNSSEDNAVSIEEDPIKSQDPNDPDPITNDKDTTGGADRPTTPVTDPNSGLKTVSVIITFADVTDDTVSANGEVTNVIETGGTCTFTFTHLTSGKTITLDSAPLPSPNSTPCTSVSSPKTNFTPGEWSVTLKYQSNNSKGESNSATFQVN